MDFHLVIPVNEIYLFDVLLVVVTYPSLEGPSFLRYISNKAFPYGNSVVAET